MSVLRFVAWRFMLKGTEKGTFSAMTLFAWLAIGVGVGAMSSLLSVMYGFESALKDRVLKAYPHIMVKPREGTTPIRNYEPWTKRLRQEKGTARVMPYVETEMIAQSSRRTIGAVVWGVPSSNVAELQANVSEGKAPEGNAKIPQVVVGVELAHRLGLEVGDELRLISPIAKRGPMGLVPQSATFKVSGLYTSGHYEFDEQYLYLLLPDAQDLLKWGDAITGWHVWAHDLSQVSLLAKRIQKILPSAWVAESWEVFNSALFQSLKLEQYSMFLILIFAIAIAVMNIVITLAMHVTYKKTNIGILRALGASRTQISRIFVWQGALMGAVGLTIGALITFVFIVYVRYFSDYQLPAIYYDRSLPVEVRPLSLVLIYGVAIVMIYLATLYPSLKAASLNPIEAIRE